MNVVQCIDIHKEFEGVAAVRGVTGRVIDAPTPTLPTAAATATSEVAAASGGIGDAQVSGFTPLDGSAASAKRVAHALFDAGVIAFVTGSEPARVRFLPPVGVITDDDIDAACAIVEQTMSQLADSVSD